MRRLLVVLALLVACTPQAQPTTTAPSVLATTSTTAATTTAAPTTTLAPATTTSTTIPPEPGTVAPDWLGTRILPLRPDGLGEIQPTPEELVNRRFPTIDLLGPLESDEFVGTVGPVPTDVLARSTWREGCPTAVEDLSYLVVSFYGFDGQAHEGELIVNARYGEGMLEVFRTAYEHRFPLEQMRVITFPELNAPPTGDSNDTTSFVCRPVVAQDSGWSMHAYGLAIDLNPFHNPYWRNEVVVPELASAYTDRAALRPGMLDPNDSAAIAIIEAFAGMGWEWGGNWQTLKDWMHFSENGR
ncbi:MAG: M15 family metallopeptidase [Acidimicrobiia bacterium]